jgi:hypothetical protein
MSHQLKLIEAARSGALLAINLLFLMIWGFAGISKVITGIPLWFGDKFGQTFLGKFPGLIATFWLLTLSEILAFGLAVIALGRAEFLGRRPALVLSGMLAWSLFVFVQLSLGQWLTSAFNEAAQQFAYFTGTLLCLHFVISNAPSTNKGKVNPPV